MSIKLIRLNLAKWLWPKDVQQGELFTIIRHIRNGQPSGDGSWIGSTLRADRVEGDTIFFSERSEFDSTRGTWRRCHTFPAIPGTNCDIKFLGQPLSKEERKKLYNQTKEINY